MKNRPLFRFLAVLAGLFAALALAGCPDYQFSKNTLGQDAVQRHYEAGDMTEAQYEQAMRSFDPTWQPPSVSGNTTSSGAGKPAAAP